MNYGFNAGLKFPPEWTDGSLINPVSGILNGVWEQPRLGGYADMFQYAALACNTAAFGGPDNFRHVGGASLDRNTAWIKAVGEGVERYCAAIYDPLDYPMCAQRDAAFATVDLSLLSLYPDTLTSSDNFPFGAITNEALIRWCSATSLAGDTVHVPCSGVFVPWYYQLALKEEPLFQPISTGLACHSTQEAARLGGVMEVVERDAFTIMWQTKTPLNEVSLDDLPDDSAEIVRRIHATGAKVRIGFIPTDNGIPVCIASQTIDDANMPAFSLAASAEPKPADAVRKALEELVHTFRWMARLMVSKTDFVPDGNFDNVVDQETHLILWCDANRRSNADFLWSGDKVCLTDVPVMNGDTPTEQLKFVCDRIEATGYTPLFVDLTTPDVAEFGFHVTRAMIPGYNPLFMGHNLRSRTNPRLVQRIAEIEASGTRTEAPINTHPHPFP